MQRSRLESVGVSFPRRGLRKWGSLDHAVKAGRDALDASHLHPRDVNVLINAGVYRDKHYAEPAFACFIQKELGINIEFQGRPVLAFDLQNGGCGMLNAAHVVTTMMQSGTAEVGMVIASEVNTDRHPDPSYPYASSGAALILDVSPLQREGFGAFVFKTYDQHSDLYSSVVSLAQKRGRLYIRRQQQLEDAYLSCVLDVWQELLLRERLHGEEIDLVLPSQLSSGFLARLATTLSMPTEKLVDITGICADTLTTSPFLAFAHARQHGRMPSGGKVAFLTLGSGITVGASVYYT